MLTIERASCFHDVCTIDFISCNVSRPTTAWAGGTPTGDRLETLDKDDLNCSVQMRVHGWSDKASLNPDIGLSRALYRFQSGVAISLRLVDAWRSAVLKQY